MRKIREVLRLSPCSRQFVFAKRPARRGARFRCSVLLLARLDLPPDSAIAPISLRASRSRCRSGRVVYPSLFGFAVSLV